MKNKSRLVLWESLLLLASVLVFRGMWMLLDRVEWMSRPVGLWISLTVGLIVGALALAAVNRSSSE